MIQLVGFHAWRFGIDNPGPIAASTVQAAISEAERTMIEQIARPVWNRLSPLSHGQALHGRYDDLDLLES
ncbi:hypothetical protein [Candidatus Poriferisodalis sp.]|uniref:hypothetical protein n=1 Tax=Candidatus Poriferisodalis sp. TaxID=3101277 RepID=UPI003B523581